jgi:hypothetical protein
VGEECIADKELLELLRKKEHPIAYDGFEPSGRMHIAQVGDGGVTGLAAGMRGTATAGV